MMEDEKEVSFFKKLIMSIKDFEKYPELASKRWTVVLTYLAKLLAIFVIIASFASVYSLAEQLQSGLQYVKEELPDFTFTNNELKMEQEEAILYENVDKLFDTIIIDTKEVNDETLSLYKEKVQKASNGIVLLKDKALVKTNVTNGIVEYAYSSISETYQINEFNKQQVLEYFSGTNLALIYIGIFAMISIYMFILYFISIWLDIILLGTLGFFTALILRLRLRFSAMCKIAVHSLTLPILLNAVVILIETFTSFKIQYFDIMYIGIAYIYIITAILMIKSDVIKNQKELVKIIEEQEKVRQELEKQKEEEETKKEEQKREKEKEEQRKKEKKKQEDENKNVGDEPQGENA